MTQLLGANRVDSVASLVSTGTTMIGISFGVLIGLALGATLVRQVSRPVRAATEGRGAGPAGGAVRT